MSARTQLCFALSRRLMSAPADRTIDYDAYRRWRYSSLSRSWQAFSDAHISGKDVLDFGCGDGQFALFLAMEKSPRRIVGVDINAESIGRARTALAEANIPNGVDVEFLLGSTDALPPRDCTFDTVVALDCLEHVMSPGPILREWHRVLRPGGRCLLEWFPYKGPWGPHMEALIPIPWAHVIFGQRAMFRAAEMIYDLPEFLPRHWDLNENGDKKPNKWRAWSTFREQGYINQLDERSFRKLARDTGFEVDRLERHGFGGAPLRRGVGRMLMNLPCVGEYFVSFAVIELVRPPSPA